MRSDRTWFCIECKLRHEQSPYCRRCSRPLVNLADPEQRARLIREKGSEARARGTSRSVPPAAPPEPPNMANRITFAIGCAVAATWAVVHWWGPCAALWFGPFLVIAIGLVHLLSRSAKRRAADKRDDDGLRRMLHAKYVVPPPTPEANATDRRTVTGVARARQPLRSPLTKAECVAWRLVGRSDGAPVDEAAGTEIELEGADASLVAVVDARAATIEIEVDAETAPCDVSPEVSALLIDRGFVEGMECELAEAFIPLGASVEVEGPSELGRRPDGYRGHVEVLVFRERPGSPLIVRRARSR